VIAPSTGSDDGLIHISRDGGTSWQNVTPPAYGKFTRTAVIETSHFDPGTAYDVANLLRRIVNHHSQLIAREPVGALNYEISHGILHVLYDASLNRIGEADDSIVSTQPERVRRAIRRQASAASPRINRTVDAAHAGIRNFLARTHARVHQLASLQNEQSFAIELRALGLIGYRPVPLKPEGCQGTQNIVGPFRPAARRVEIFHAQQPLSAGTLGVEIAAHRGNQRTEMQGPGGRWGEAAAVGEVQCKRLLAEI
jgi:hypothetical protein